MRYQVEWYRMAACDGWRRTAGSICFMDNQVLIDYITDTLGGEIGEGYSDPYGQERIIAVEEAP